MPILGIAPLRSRGSRVRPAGYGTSSTSAELVSSLHILAPEREAERESEREADACSTPAAGGSSSRRRVAVVMATALSLILLTSTTWLATGAQITEAPLTNIERIADGVPFDWRAHGVTFAIGCSTLQAHCPPAAYETASRTILIAERSLDTDSLEDLVLHELAHAWQFTIRGWPDAADDLSAWGYRDIQGLELAADCLATIWGARHTRYWICPPDAVEHVRTLIGPN